MISSTYICTRSSSLPSLRMNNVGSTKPLEKSWDIRNEDNMDNNRGSRAAALFDNLEEGGSRDIVDDDHENEKSLNSLQDQVVFLKRMFSLIRRMKVTDPFLADHLAFFGIDFSFLQKTEMTTTEKELDQNTNFDWNRIQESGKEVEPFYGPGCQAKGSCLDEGVELKDAMMIGADYYQTDSTITAMLANGRVPIGVGQNTKITNCIFDKNAKIGKNVVIANKDNMEEADRSDERFYIRSGITIILKNATIKDGTLVQ
ncbi:glucose-1-phosphate adenylyltransferase large subunit 2, chloroplastic/amyloplastic-like protein [Tanacetum coccineum]